MQKNCEKHGLRISVILTFQFGEKEILKSLKLHLKMKKLNDLGVYPKQSLVFKLVLMWFPGFHLIKKNSFKKHETEIEFDYTLYPLYKCMWGSTVLNKLVNIFMIFQI